MKTIPKLLTLLAVSGLIVSPVALAGGSQKSEAPVFWTYELGEPMPMPVGTSKVVRTKHGISAQIKTTGLTPGHAMTMWIIFFNYPQHCKVKWMCNPDDDGGNPLVGFDFHYAAGHVVNGNKTTLSGHLQLGETSTSGLADAFGAPPVALLNPFGAQVALAVHSHGPAQTGQTLKEQMSSFTGGCVYYLPVIGGLAQTTDDIPDLVGECATHQLAPHPTPASP